jgi:hypothetical protein
MRFLIPEGSKVVELGCGIGNLLAASSHPSALASTSALQKKLHSHVERLRQGKTLDCDAPADMMDFTHRVARRTSQSAGKQAAITTSPCTHGPPKRTIVKGALARLAAPYKLRTDPRRNSVLEPNQSTQAGQGQSPEAL